MATEVLHEQSEPLERHALIGHVAEADEEEGVDALGLDIEDPGGIESDVVQEGPMDRQVVDIDVDETLEDAGLRSQRQRGADRGLEQLLPREVGRPGGRLVQVADREVDHGGCVVVHRLKDHAWVEKAIEDPAREPRGLPDHAPLPSLTERRPWARATASRLP